MLVVFEDITAARRASAEKDILLEETRHRIKNLLATMRSIATLTRTEGRTAEEYKEAFLGRFQAVVEAQDLALSGVPVQDLEKLLHMVTGHVGERVTIEPGPEVTVPQAKVGSLGLILHEMATNAMKYGALSRAKGRVLVRWDVIGGSEGRTLRLHWREEDGPAPQPDSAPGFGSRLIQFGARDLGGSAELAFEPEGCRMKLTFPLE